MILRITLSGRPARMYLWAKLPVFVQQIELKVYLPLATNGVPHTMPTDKEATVFYSGCFCSSFSLNSFVSKPASTKPSVFIKAVEVMTFTATAPKRAGPRMVWDMQQTTPVLRVPCAGTTSVWWSNLLCLSRQPFSSKQDFRGQIVGQCSPFGPIKQGQEFRSLPVLFHEALWEIMAAEHNVYPERITPQREAAHVIPQGCTRSLSFAVCWWTASLFCCCPGIRDLVDHSQSLPVGVGSPPSFQKWARGHPSHGLRLFCPASA